MVAKPKDAADDVFRRARSLTAAANRVSDPETAEDLYRMGLALGVAALDTYLHWAVRRVSLEQPTKALGTITIDFIDLIETGKASVEARNAGILDRPKVRARNVLNRKLRTMTFQNPAGVENAMRLLGCKDFWRSIAKEMPNNPTPEDVKTRLSRVADHRNRIVHEGDLKHLQRPQKIEREKLNQTAVLDDITWLEELVRAVDAVLNT